MLDRTTKKQDPTCQRCGSGPVKIIVGRVGRLDRGHTDILQCESCGRISQRDAQPPETT